MKKKNKNLLTLALAIMVVGAGVGAAKTFNGFSANDVAVAADADEGEVYENDITSIVSVSKVTLSASYKSRYDVVINFGDITFNSDTFYTNQYPNSDQIGVKITDYIVINGQTMTELYTKYNAENDRKEWLDDLDDGTKNNYENEDWGFNKGWVPVVGQVNTNNLTLMIDRRFVAPTDLELTIKNGLRLSYTDEEGAAIAKVTEDITFSLISDASNVQNLKGVRTDAAEIVKTTATAVALTHSEKMVTETNVQYQLHTDLLFSSSYQNGSWTANNYMYLNDYFTINGKTFSQWNKETYLAEYTTGAISDQTWCYQVPLLNYLWAKSAIASDSGTIFQFYISKAWMTAMEIDENTMTLGIREGLTYLNADGKVAKTTNALSYQKSFKATVVVDGTSSTITYNASNRAEKLAEIAAKLPQNTAEYTYAWAEALPSELPLEDGKTYTANKKAVEYTAKVVVDGAESTVTYTVENRADKLTEIAAKLPENTAAYTYAWSEALPGELPLENGKTYTVTKTAVEYTVTFKADGEQVGTALQFTTETKGSLTFPEVPAKDGYTAAWDKTVADITECKHYEVNAVYTAIEYTATLDYLEGEDGTLTYTVENRAEKLAEIIAATNAKNNAQYKCAWNFPETLPLENGKTYSESRVAAEYNITFKADGANVSEGLKFTADTDKSTLAFPEVPAKDGYTAAWDTTIENITDWKDYTVTAVYTAIEYTAKVVVDGAESNVTYTIENRADKLAEIAAKLPKDTAEYMYAWAEALPTELPLEDGKTYTVTKTAVEYTATVVVNGTSSTVTYTVENRADKLAEIAAKLPKDTAEYTYAWAEALPTELPLENGKTYTVTKTAVPVDSSNSSDTTDSSVQDSSDKPNSSVQDSSDKPNSSVQNSSDKTNSSAQASSGGCSGVISGISAGVLALGAAAMLLKKKKEDK